MAQPRVEPGARSVAPATSTDDIRACIDALAEPAR
jgi:hypothetical protein